MRVFYPDWSLKMSVFQEEENRRTRRKILLTKRESTTNLTHIKHQAGIVLFDALPSDISIA